MEGTELPTKQKCIVKHDAMLEMLAHFATTKPEEDAIVFLSTDKPREVVSWFDLYSRSKKVAHALVDIGVKRGEIVAVSIRTCPEWLYVALGAMLMGALPINLVFTYKDGSDVVAMMKKLGKCSFLALDPGNNNENWDILMKLMDDTSVDGTARSSQMPYLRYLVCHHPSQSLPGVKMLHEWMSEPHPEHKLPLISPHDEAFLFQTSGSTGVPKVVIHTYQSFGCARMFDVVGVDFSLAQYNDRPFGWIGGFPFGILYGHKRVTMSGFSPLPKDKVAFVMEAVQNEGCKLVMMLPSSVAELISRKESQSGLDWQCDAIFTGGQPLTSQTMKAVGLVCKEIIVAYAGTEFFLISLNRVHDAATFEEMNCGLPSDEIEVKIVDRQGAEAPMNTTGEVCVRSKWGFEGYFNDPERSKSLLTEDGWFRTGDIGKRNERSELFVMGRMSHEIIRAGMNISPEILESVLKDCPLIENALIVPIPDERLYQELCACVKFKPGVKATKDDVRKYCEDVHADSERVFSYLPAYYVIFSEFPVTGTGKVSRQSVAKMAFQMITQDRT